MRRFIAGAVCPQCRAVDRIVLERESTAADASGEERLRRVCVSCGYNDTLAAGSAPEPPTRFSRRGRDEAAPATAVKIVDSPRRKP